MQLSRRNLVRGCATTGLALLVLLLVFHPSRPLWIRSEEFTLSASDGVSLSGTLSSPRWRKPVGAVVVVHGSGPLTREHLRGDVRSLVANGFAVLHYDKRGAGSSRGEYLPSAVHPMTRIVDVLSDDAATMMGFLQTRLKNERVEFGFFGASQAGWIIPLAVTKCRDRPSFLIVISGTPATTGLEGHYSQLTGDGAGPPRLTDWSELKRRTLEFAGDSGFDPLPIWKSIDCETLWLLGDIDLSVPTFASVEILDAQLRSGHSEHRVVRYPNAGHDLRDVDTGEPADIWPTVVEWYQNRARN